MERMHNKIMEISKRDWKKYREGDEVISLDDLDEFSDDLREAVKNEVFNG